MKLCLACSAGGHLTELTQLANLYKKHDHFFVTFEREDTRDLAREERVYFVVDPKRNPVKLVKNIFQSLIILLKERPDFVITTTAGVVIPTCYLGKLMGAKIIFIETFCRPNEGSLTGKIVYPIADLFLVQWKETLKRYGKKAKYGGPIF